MDQAAACKALTKKQWKLVCFTLELSAQQLERGLGSAYVSGRSLLKAARHARELKAIREKLEAMFME